MFWKRRGVSKIPLEAVGPINPQAVVSREELLRLVEETWKKAGGDPENHA